jgi:hypothetical protein
MSRLLAVLSSKGRRLGVSPFFFLALERLQRPGDPLSLVRDEIVQFADTFN